MNGKFSFENFSHRISIGSLKSSKLASFTGINRDLAGNSIRFIFGFYVLIASPKLSSNFLSAPAPAL
jgi:hypothetical protein